MHRTSAARSAPPRSAGQIRVISIVTAIAWLTSHVRVQSRLTPRAAVRKAFVRSVAGPPVDTGLDALVGDGGSRMAFGALDPAHGGVVVHYDGSDEARCAVDWAAVEARSRTRSLVLVGSTGWQWQALNIGLVLGTGEETHSGQVRAAVEAELREVAARVHRAHRGLDIHAFVADGAPGDATTAVAGEVEPCLIVTGTPGSRRLGGLAPVGLSAATPIRRGRWPVVAAGRNPSVSEPGDPAGPVVITADRAVVNDQVAEFAFEFASRHGKAVRVMPNPEARGLAAHSARFLVITRLLATLDRYPGVSVDTGPLFGPQPGNPLSQARDAALFVVARHISGAPSRVLPRMAVYRWIHRVPCPVAFVGDRAGAPEPDRLSRSAREDPDTR